MADDPFDPFLFLSFLRKCATQSNLRLRVLASRALTGLVSNEKLPAVIIEVASCLPNGRHQMNAPRNPSVPSLSANISNGVGARHTYATSFNSIHGLLLQLSSLLDNNCRGLSDTAMKDQILGELVQNLSRCSWIGRTRSCPCPTLNTSYLRVLDFMIIIARTYSSNFTSAIRDLLLETASESLDAVTSCNLALHDPTLVELRKQAVFSYFTCLLRERNEDSEGIQLLRYNSSSRLPKVSEAEISVAQVQERITSLLSDPTYEVRLATLKKLLQLVQCTISGEDNGAIYTWAETYLHPFLVNLLPLEENPKCIYYILRIFYHWNLLQLDKSIHADQDFAFLFWDKLVNLNKGMVRAKTREISLCCMGICIRKLARLLMSFLLDEGLKQDDDARDSSKIDCSMITRAFRNIDAFISLVKHHSSPSEPVTMRKAAAEAIIASGLLAEAIPVASSLSRRNYPSKNHVSNIDEVIANCEISKIISIYACRILYLWFTCIQLLEDEDIALREKLAKDVQISINSGQPNKSPFAEDAHVQVDRVIASSFDFLSSVFGNWLEYLNHLTECVFITATSPVSSDGDLVRQIFDKEIDNHHEEKLLICQICCMHLEKLSVSKALEVGTNPLVLDKNTQTFLWGWRFRFLRQLTSLANAYHNTEGKAGWIGGIGNHKDAFISVYANLLGLYALSHSLSEGCRESTDTHKLYLSEFLGLGGVIRPLLKNPLISKLYGVLIQLHHKMLGASQAQQSAGNYPSCSFDPYFLLG